MAIAYLISHLGEFCSNHCVKNSTCVSTPSINCPWGPLALKVSESKVNEVIHVGDSYDSDIAGAIALDIKAILIDRDESQQKSTYQFVINELKTLYDHL